MLKNVATYDKLISIEVNRVEQTTHEFKYQKHSEKQYLTILSIAEDLFVRQGIDKVGLSDIAGECGIMRSTLYRYFKNKDELLWHIMHRNTLQFSQKLMEKYQTVGGTTYERFEILFEILVEEFQSNTNLFLFIDQFNNIYQDATSHNNNVLYDSIYSDNDFRSKDLVRFLTEGFHDGSVKPELDPKTTAVTMLYSAISIAAGMSKQMNTLSAKYGVEPKAVVELSFRTLLGSIKACSE